MQRSSLKKQVLWIVGGLIGVILVLSISYNLWRTNDINHQSLEQRGNLLSDFIAGALQIPLWNVNLHAVNNILEVVSHDPDFHSAQIEDKSGMSITVGSSHFDPTKQIQFKRTIFYQDEGSVVNERIGTLTLNFSTQRIHEELYKKGTNEVILLLVLLILNLTVIYFGLRLFTHPIDKLSKNMKSFANGNYHLDVYGINRKDEIGIIAEALEVLRLNSIDREEIKLQLETSNQLLEHRVNQRTKALALEVEERKQAEHRALAADHAKSVFLANMSHEIRTPMNAIIGLSFLALKDDLPSHQKDYLSKIEISAHSLLKIINEILDFSKIEAHQLKIEKVSFSLNQVLDQLINITALKATEKGLEFLIEIDPTLPDSLHGDPTRLQQVLINLTNNAAKFTMTGKISLKIGRQKMEDGSLAICFTLTDSGIGMSQEQLLSLFQPFSQADSSTTRKFGGTGLGLAISKQLVELMGGNIGVESQVKQGASFYFTLPLLSSDQSAAPTPSLEGRHVLVVDDNASAREVIQKSLRQYGVDAKTASSEAAATTLIKQQSDQGTPFQLILLDWQIDHSDSLQMVSNIQQAHSTETIPFLLMVPIHLRSEIEVQSLDANHPVLMKPFTPSKLLEAIANTIDLEVIHASPPLPPATGAEKSTQAIDYLQGMEVLLVEDNLINQQVAREVLIRAGIEVSVANHGEEALLFIQQHHYDAVLMDIQMPVMDGYEATRQIRKQFFQAELPIIAMTANALPEDRERALDAGMNDHIAKPIDVAELYKKLSIWNKKVNYSLAPHPTTPVMDEETRLPDTLPGLNVAEGLQRVMGNQEIYIQILNHFTTDNQHLMDTLEQKISAGDPSALKHAIHTLKGTAGNISANQLADEARLIELQIIQDETPSTTDLARLEECLNETINSINLIIASADPIELDSSADVSVSTQTEEKQLPINNDLLLSQLQQLDQLLQSHDLSAKQILQLALPSLTQKIDASQIESLTLSIDHLDFSTAQRQLNSIRGEL